MAEEGSINSGDESVSDIENEEPNILQDRKSVVSTGELLKLFRACHWECCGKCLVRPPRVFECGFGLWITTECIDGHDYMCHSQPLVGGIMECNVSVPAIFVTGNECSPFMEVCDTIGLTTISKSQWRCVIVVQHTEGLSSQRSTTPGQYTMRLN